MKVANFLMRKSLLIGLLIFVIGGFIFLLRRHNQNKYRSFSSPTSPKYYQNPSDLSLYPTELENVVISPIDHNGAQGFHFVPNQLKHKGVVVVFGGSEGTPGYDQATFLAQNGYEVFAMFMFGQSHQSPTMARVPLEQFEDILSVIKTEAMSSSPITLFGASKGAEYALNLATKYTEIDHLILISPSSYNFAGLDFNQYGSSWTWKGKELPYIDLKKSSFLTFLLDVIFPQLIYSPLRYKEVYATAINNDKNKENKRIPVEETSAKILLISGKDDQMWDSFYMSTIIQNGRLKQTSLKAYDNAGHIFASKGILASNSILLNVGGTQEGNKKAQKESSQLILKKLKEWHD